MIKSYLQLKKEAVETFMKRHNDIFNKKESFEKGFEIGWMLSWKYEKAKNKEE